MAHYEITPCTEQDETVIQDGLHAYNRQFFDDSCDLNLCLRDGDGACVGGLLGWYANGLVMVDMLWVEESHRGEGLGARLLNHAEQTGREKGATCVELNTFGFQAPAFYEKRGYRLFGKIEPAIGGYGHFHYVKALTE